MIDFRYHLVSLMAVLVALTIGVILGAGPLQGPLSDTLTGQVDRLTQRQSELTEKNNRLETAIEQGQQFIDATSALTVSHMLTGVPVALVRTFDASDTAVTGMQSLLEAAGASVTVTARLEPAWLNDVDETTRQAVAKRLAGYVGDLAGAEASDEDILAAGLIVATTTNDENTQVVRDLLAADDAKLLTVSGSEPAQAVVLITATHADLGADTGAGKDLLMVRSTGRAIGATAGSGIIVGDAETDQDLIAMLRHDAVPVATSDSIAKPRGRIVAVLGLAAARNGHAAAFGTGLGATEAVPEVSAP